MIDNVPQLREDLKSNGGQRSKVCFGTVDSWLLYQLTGTPAGAGAANSQGVFCTDVTNASRWMFMNLSTTQWDQQLVDAICAPHSVPISTALPQIMPSSYNCFGHVTKECGIHSLKGQRVPLTAILGDQQVRVSLHYDSSCDLMLSSVVILMYVRFYHIVGRLIWTVRF